MLYLIQLFLVLASVSSGAWGFTTSSRSSSLFSSTSIARPFPSNDRSAITRLFQSPDDESPSEDNTEDADDEEEPPIIATSTVKIDDGGSDLTDRFKYKVNALMGVFDPADAEADKEGAGNILNALLKFPVKYSFNVVGKTRGDEQLQDEFVQQVKAIVAQETGGEDGLVVQVTPRGKSFTKVIVEAEVDSAPIIQTVYQQLGALEMSVMQF